MVYGGKPSTGCQMCKLRRVKCDEARPVCHNCVKSRRACPGYMDEFDLMFRNETKATEMRARKTKNTGKKAQVRKGRNQVPPEDKTPQPATKIGGPRPDAESNSQLIVKMEPPTSKEMTIQSFEMFDPQSLETFGSQSSDDFENSSTSISPYNFSEEFITPTLNMPLESRAFCHFLANFVLLPRNSATRGFFEFLTPMVETFHLRPLHFQHAFRACAYASLANRSGAGHGFIDTLAYQEYNSALCCTGYAMDDHIERKQMVTTATVLLLGLFENLTASQLGTLSWGSHIGAATSIMREQSHSLVETTTGLSLFVAVRTQMIIQSLSSGQAPHLEGDFWIKFTVNDEYASKCQRLSIMAAEYRASAHAAMLVKRDAKAIARMRDLVQKGLDLDQDCIQWTNDLPAEFGWERVAWEVNVPDGDYARAEVFPGRVDAYQDLWVASVWNMMRVTRIIIASLVVRCSAWANAPIDYRTTPEFAGSAKICIELIADIIAAIPYQLGWFIKRKHLLQGPHLSSFLCGEEDSQKSLAGYFLTWPLACIIGQDYCSDLQRTWARGRLRYIGSHLGVRYAHMLSKLHILVPSMLIRRDGLMAAPADFEHMLSHKTKGQLMTKYRKGSKFMREPLDDKVMQEEMNQLVRAAMGKSGAITESTARFWLQIEHTHLARRLQEHTNKPIFYSEHR